MIRDDDANMLVNVKSSEENQQMTSVRVTGFLGNLLDAKDKPVQADRWARVVGVVSPAPAQLNKVIQTLSKCCEQVRRGHGSGGMRDRMSRSMARR